PCRLDFRGIARWRARRYAARRQIGRALRHLLVWVDAPDIAAPEPAGDVAGLDPAPLRTAFEEVADDAWLGPGDHRGGCIRLPVERPHPALDDDLALAGQHPLM